MNIIREALDALGVPRVASGQMRPGPGVLVPGIRRRIGHGNYPLCFGSANLCSHSKKGLRHGLGVSPSRGNVGVAEDLLHHVNGDSLRE